MSQLTNEARAESKLVLAMPYKKEEDVTSLSQVLFLVCPLSYTDIGRHIYNELNVYQNE